jgi:hypothetical protein
MRRRELSQGERDLIFASFWAAAICIGLANAEPFFVGMGTMVLAGFAVYVKFLRPRP